MSLFNYIGTPNSNLICCICRAPFNDPITTVTCQHTFCRECILRALSHAPQCPVDRLPLSEDELAPTNSIVRSMVDELLVECVYKQDGCSYQGERQQLPIHLKEQCLLSEDGKLRRELNNRAGSTSRNEAEEEKTSLVNTDAVPPAVKLTPNGVKQHDPRISQLTEQNILLRHRVESLENVVQVFKKEMNAVKMVLGPWMQNAMATPTPVSRYRSGSVNQTRPSSSGEPLPLSAIPESTSSGVLQPPEIPSMAPLSPPESAAGDDDSSLSPPGPSLVNTADLASYFPADNEVRVQRSVPPQSQQRRSPPQSQRSRPGHAHHHSVPVMPTGDPYSNYASNFNYALGPGGYSTMSPSFPSYAVAGPSSTSLTPVSDLVTSSPSILHTFQGIQSNLTALSSNIDELNRKTDLALGLIGGGGVAMLNGGVVGEVLRLGEEVMGVRANVQGLRMQVHGMLMGAAGGSFSNPGLPRQPNPQSSPNPNHGMSEEEASLAGRGQIPFPTGLGSMSPAMGLNPRFSSFPGPLGITKL
ncbi:hypothetical protein BKA70DRAFT_663777 [Coprinopsis sp. MPI-PUGE-AT-0042]|nr:hypothetical protein BKA70DRAFT_663777 [Coprinopsis sp. MPI-PUGE-AT-0042]